VNPAADPQSRQFGVKVRLENKNHILRPGMYGHLAIVTHKTKAQVVVPTEAVLTAPDGTTTVAVVDDKSVIHVRPVKLGVRDTKGIEILDGVSLGEQVVVLTFNTLKDKQKVKIAVPDGKGKDTNKTKGERKDSK
jgi:RND family efflux transporter MFP subunit